MKRKKKEERKTEREEGETGRRMKTNIRKETKSRGVEGRILNSLGRKRKG